MEIKPLLHKNVQSLRRRNIFPTVNISHGLPDKPNPEYTKIFFYFPVKQWTLQVFYSVILPSKLVRLSS